MLRDEYKNLSTPEKIILVEEIWDSIAQDASIDINPEQKKLITKREKELIEGKVKTKTWAELKKGLDKKEK